MEIARSRKGIAISKRKYTLDLLNKTRMLGNKLVDTPLELDYKLKFTQESQPVESERYQKLVGKAHLFNSLNT